MKLTPGTQLGHYELLAPLGAGGMGEVYRARDTRLDRAVAIKVLPADFAHDAERLKRFEQEARATSALNHPNILTVHDIGTAPPELGGAPFIVMELLEGEELRARLNDGALPVRTALEYAQQIAAGLSAAHDKGITHRDLKPENLFITKDGRVKILDFGLAKLKPRKFGGGVDSEAPTMKPLTNPGVILGTVGYMSPEQVRGQEADHRSDIFSFGMILYEMLSGRRAFSGVSVADVMSAILREEPPELSETNAKISPALDKIVRRCLEKKPERRFQSASDLSFALDALATASSSGANRTEAVAALTTGSSQSGSGWRERIAWIAAGALAVALLALGVAYVRRPALEAEPVRLFLNPPEKAVSFNYPTISPDGRTLGFLARVDGKTQIWVRPLSASTAKPLAGTDNADWLFWSPDNQFLAFFAVGKLNKIPLSGGTPIPLTDIQTMAGGTWNREGVILFGAGNAGIQRISVNGGAASSVTTVDGSHREINHGYPFFLPNGRQFLFHLQHNDPNKQGIYLASLDGDEAKQLITTEVRTVWAGENPATPGAGYLVFIQQSALMAQSFDFGQNQLSGEPVRLVEHVQTGRRGFNGQFSLAGKALVVMEGITSQQLTWVDRAGKKVGTIGSVGVYGIRDLSPDGQRLAVTRYDPKIGAGDIWLFELAGGRETRFTVDPAEDTFPKWSPDGSRIVWASNRKGLHGLYQKAANGAGQDELLFESANPKMPMQWSPDGRFILYREQDAQTGFDLWVLPMEGERKPYPWLKTQFNESTGDGISPDGKWLAYGSNESGRTEIYIQAFVPGTPASGAKWLISTGGGSMPIWRRDGRGLYYFDAIKGKMMEVEVSSGATINAGLPRELFDTRAIRADLLRAWTMTRDEQRFAVCDERGRNYRATVHGRNELDGGVEEVSEPHKQKLYCYVDETGQDTEGQLFLVSVVVTEQEQEAFARELERIEAESGKRRIKWHKSSAARKIAYVKAVLACPIFQRTIYFSHYTNSKAYVDLTVYTTAKAILQRAPADYKATIIVDGLSGSEVRHFSSELRKLHIRIRKVRGARDEAEPGIRLADAFAGFIRDALEGEDYAQELYREAHRRGFVREV